MCFVSSRSACVIDDGDTALLLGGARTGYYYYNTVQRFDITGLLETLPSLNLARTDLACGKYQNSEGEKVRRTPSSDHFMLLTEVRSTWLLEALHQED